MTRHCFCSKNEPSHEIPNQNEKGVEKGVSLSVVLECIVLLNMTHTLNARFLLANEFLVGLYQ